MHDYCAACHVQFLRGQGDTWAFLVFIDRAAFLFPLVVGFYFRQYYQASWLAFGGFGLVMVALFVWTTPNRSGLSVAIDYLTRGRGEEQEGETSR